MKIENVGQLKNLLKDLDNDLPVGTYHKNWWYPTFDKHPQDVEIIKQGNNPIGIAIEIDRSLNY